MRSTLKPRAEAWSPLPLSRLSTPDANSLATIDRCAELLYARYFEKIRATLSERTTNPDINSAAIRLLIRLGYPPAFNTKLIYLAQINPRFRKTWEIFQAGAIHHAEKVCASKTDCGSCSLISFCNTARRKSSRTILDGAIIDIFSGAGALSAGFHKEGFRPALAIELSRHAAQSYRHNHPGVPVLEMDARRLSIATIKNITGLRAGQFCAVIGGPPCQGYSAAGKRNPRAAKNLLFRVIADIASSVKAPYVVMENVPGLNRVNGYSFRDRITAYFTFRGYNLSVHDVDASDYGVPQKRRRIIFLGSSKHKKRIPLPKFSTKNLSVKNALQGLPRIAPGHGGEVSSYKGRSIYNHHAMHHGKAVIEKIRTILPGKGPLSYRRLPPNLAQTIIAGHRAMPVHYSQHRTITVREAARIQTLPDSYRFLGPRGEQPLQVANAVPFNLARAVARAVKRDKRTTQ